MKEEIYLQPHPKDMVDTRFLTSSIVKLPLYPPHHHINFEIVFVLKGKATHVINGIKYPWHKNRCSIIRPSDNHYYKDTTNHIPFSYEHKDIYATSEQVKKICDALDSNLYKKIISHPDPIEFFISDECIYSTLNKIEAMRTCSDKTLALSLHSIILATIITQWLLSQQNLSQKCPEWITTLTTDLNNIEILALSVSDIAKRTGYSLPYFSRTFKQFMGETFISYVTKKRMHSSLGLLKSGMSIINISQALGYSNPSTFCRHFHNEFGCPPNKYRQKGADKK
jgi:AraC-like DNA-binding protein